MSDPKQKAGEMEGEDVNDLADDEWAAEVRLMFGLDVDEQAGE